MPNIPKGYIIVDGNAFPGHVVAALFIGTGPSIRTSVHMIATESDAKAWAENVIGLCLFPAIFGRVMADTDFYNADWSDSAEYRLEAARKFMEMMPVQTRFPISAVNTDECRISSHDEMGLIINTNNYHLGYYGLDGHMHVTICADDSDVDVITLHHEHDPEETAMDLIIAGITVRCTVDGAECLASLTDDKLTIINCTTSDSKIYDVGAALVMLFRLMFARDVSMGTITTAWLD